MTNVLRSSIAVLVSAMMLVGWAGAASAGILIKKINYDGAGPEDGSNKSLNAEYLVIKNKGSRAKKMGGWKIVDKRPNSPGGDRVYRFPKFKLGAGKTVKVHTGRGSNNKRHLYWGLTTYVWGNDNDTAYLYNRSGKEIDQCSYDSKTKPSPASC